MAKKYGVKFDVEMGGKAINVIEVSLGRRLERDLDAAFNVDLCDDPLYPALCEYVANNPPRAE